MYYRKTNSGNQPNSQLVGFLAGCVAGIMIGGALGLLMAPHRGDISRRKIAKKAEATKEQVVEKVEDLMVHRRQEEDHNGDEKEAN